MKKAKKVIISVIILLVAIIVIILGCIYLGSNHWDKRFHSELDRFFGEGNWECVSAETKDSIMYEEYHYSRNIAQDSSTPGKYKNWYISVKKDSHETDLWAITNHTYKINQEEYGFFSSNRLSNKQAFILELFDIACVYAGEEVRDEILCSVLSEKEADCFRVEISYEGGKPEPEFYDQLWKEDWFTADQLTAENFLTGDLYDFYIDIHLYDYRFEEMSEEEQEQVLDSFERIQEMLLDEYGENASFDLYFDGEHKAEWRNGELHN